ncbi:zinc-ribbon domain-containing protein [Qipengyuania sp. MTN3-11]|uniref:zinc-ribbon domain-containing protein n=1 Tax=Qipengyuania sp. MTN3-11 TaxID=3056557 RepID=UPI0036F21FE7
MIIACPACNTRYVVPDSAIGAEGRTVRCAKCKHSWFQDGPDMALPERPNVAPASPPSTPPVPDRETEGYTHRTGDDDVPPPSPVFGDGAGRSSTSHSEGVAVHTAPDDDHAPDFRPTDPPHVDPVSDREARLAEPDFSEEASQFEYAPPFRPRRNWSRIWTWTAALFAVLALGTVAAVNFLGVPDWVPIQRPLFAMAEPDLKLEFPVEEQERRTLANGTEFFGARITVTNEARESRDVPPILIVLRDARERIVYSWEVIPPQASLAPGETMTINEAITDVPKAAVFADIGWAPR